MGPTRIVDAGFEALWDEFLVILDHLLDRLEANYATIFSILDELLVVDAPTRADVQRLRNEVPNSLVVLRYFFDQLQNPKWFPLLRKEGYFSHPLEPDVSEDNGRVVYSYGLWPQSRFLVRIARTGAFPKELMAACVEAGHTENFRIQVDLLEVALSLPAGDASALVPMCDGWLNQTASGLLTSKLGELLQHLLKGNEHDAAMALARHVFQVSTEPARAAQADGEKKLAVYSSRDLVAKLDPYVYRELLAAQVPLLTEVCGLSALEFLCDLLEQAVEPLSVGSSGSPAQDNSCSWRPTIEESPQNADGYIQSHLVTAVRECSLQLVSSRAVTAAAVVQVLEARRRVVFRRLALHVLRQHTTEALDEVRMRLVCEELFQNCDLSHEYALLLHEGFPRLALDDQRMILGWIDRGPDLEEYRALFASLREVPLTEAEVEQHASRWRLRYLWLIRECLPLDRQEDLRILIQRLGEPEHFGFQSYSTSRIGHASPLDAEALERLSNDQLVAYLHIWTPPAGVMMEGREVLSRAITSMVADNPGRFAAAALDFRDLDRTYVRGFLLGLREAARTSEFAWAPVLQLGAWVIAQPRDAMRDLGEGDPHWGWSRKALASLIAAGLGQQGARIPSEFAAEVWKILEELSTDPDPPPERASGGPGGWSDPITLSVNTTRGETLHAVVRFVLWLARDPHSHPCAPAAWHLLEAHLDPEVDSSLAIRAVYGYWFPALFASHRHWASRNVARLFPSDSRQERLWRSAWETLVVHRDPGYDSYDLLSGEYERAVSYLDPVSASEPTQYERRLADHVIDLYTMGRIDLGPASLVAQFFQHASLGLRRAALQGLGFRLVKYRGALDYETRSRVERLWEQRLDLVQRRETPAAELSAFGWWFRASCLESAWVLTQLRIVVRLGVRLDSDLLLSDRLATLCRGSEAEGVRCLTDLMPLVPDHWWLEQRQGVSRLLEAAVASGDSSTRLEALELANRLVAHGHTEFRALAVDHVGPVGARTASEEQSGQLMNCVQASETMGTPGSTVAPPSQPTGSASETVRVDSRSSGAGEQELWTSLIKNLLGRKGLTGRALAGAMGVSATTVSKWRTGRSVPSPSAQERLRRLMD